MVAFRSWVPRDTGTHPDWALDSSGLRMSSACVHGRSGVILRYCRSTPNCCSARCQMRRDPDNRWKAVAGMALAATLLAAVPVARPGEAADPLPMTEVAPAVYAYIGA